MKKIFNKWNPFARKSKGESVTNYPEGDVLTGLVGKRVARPGKCDKCKYEPTDCKKVEVRGLGDVCLVGDEHEKSAE